MHRNGHLGAALLAYAPLAAVTTAVAGRNLALAGALLAAGLAMLPDVDQRLPGIEHRGPTHTVHFVVGAGLLVGLAVTLGSYSRVGLFGAARLGTFAEIVSNVAIGSHIVADALTPAGVDPFGDGRRVSYDLVRADSTIGNYLLLAAGGAATVAALWLGGLA